MTAYWIYGYGIDNAGGQGGGQGDGGSGTNKKNQKT